MIETLKIQNVNTIFNTGVPVSQFNSGHFELRVPQSSVTMAKPLSYDFRVAEYVDGADKVVKVGLQVAVFEHDNYGVRQLRKDWTDVPRVRLPFVE